MRLHHPKRHLGILAFALAGALTAAAVAAGSASAITFGDPTVTTTINGYGTVTVTSGGTPHPACTSPASTPQSSSYTGCATVNGSLHENAGSCSGSICVWNVTLQATAPSGWHFAGWSGDCTGTGSCTNVVETQDCTTVTGLALVPRAPICETDYSPTTVTASFVDDRAPTTTFSTRPATNSVVYSDTRSQTFTWSTDEDNEAPSFACKKDAGTFSACSSGLTWSSIADGVHDFCVHGTDASGLTGADGCVHWEQETNPTASISTHPPLTTGSPDATFTYTSNKAGRADGSTLSYQCKLDTGSFTTCPPGGYRDLADGEHTFQVESLFVAALGGTTHTSAAASYTWTVDTTPPETTIDTVLTGPITDTTPSFAFHSSEPASTFECSIDTGTPTWAPCSGPGATDAPASPLALGTYTFRVRASDQIGNTDPTPATETFTISAPSTTTPPPTGGAPTATTTTPTATTKKKCKKGRKLKHGRCVKKKKKR